jgi:hypothetical protein
LKAKENERMNLAVAKLKERLKGREMALLTA